MGASKDDILRELGRIRRSGNLMARKNRLVDSIMSHKLAPQIPNVPASAQNQMTLGDIARTGLEFVPALGDALDAAASYDAASKGAYGQAGLSGLGLLPFVPGTVARKLDDVGGVMKRLYHGTPAKFDKPGLDTANALSERGRALYLTDSPDEAAWYASGTDASAWGRARNAEGDGRVLEFELDDVPLLDEMEPAKIIDESGELTERGRVLDEVVRKYTDEGKALEDDLEGYFRQFARPEEARNEHVLDYLGMIWDDEPTTDAIAEYVQALGYKGTVGPSIGKASKGAKDYAIFDPAAAKLVSE